MRVAVAVLLVASDSRIETPVTSAVRAQVASAPVASTSPVPHMSLLAVYPVVIGFVVLFSWMGIRGFTKRVIA